MNETKDVVVIGGGPGGYAAAFLAASYGFRTTLVDMRSTPGGVCLHCGCIPSKALLHAAKLLTDAREAMEIGIDFGQPRVEIDKIRLWKERVVSQLTTGLSQQCLRRGVTFIQGQATFLGSNQIAILKPDGQQSELLFDHCILATGSRPTPLPGIPLQSPRVMDSTAALAFEQIPERLLVVGGGVIGLELGSVYATFGSRVTIVEMSPTLLPGADRDLVRVVAKRLEKLTESIRLESKVTALVERADGLLATLENSAGQAEELHFDRVLVAIGRLPNSENLGLEKTRVRLERGLVQVDRAMRTADPAILAIGDVVGGPMLAHKAAHEARIAVEVLAGKKAQFDPRAIPVVAFTDPEVAWAGLTETEAKKQGIPVKAVRFPWGASGRAHTLGQVDGSTKLIVDPETERVLGIGMTGPGAGEMISEGVLALEMGATVRDLAETIHPHPTLSETVMEAAEVFFGHSVHYFTPRQNR
ncbi:MAG: dihydrolipoyl dehydrogenase [Magnetococcales bacterium]|nr:dihydrolipoyl dehydrogenase [Magnetococcales bacterium]